MDETAGMCWLRKWGYLISTNANFEFVIIVLIFANIVTLAAYDPLEPDSSLRNLVLDRISECLCLPQRVTCCLCCL